MSDDTIRGQLESAMAGTPEAEAATPEESFEQFATRHVANGGGLGEIELMRTVDTEFPYFQDERNLDWAKRALSHVARTNPTFFGDQSDSRSVLAKLQSIGEEADRNREARHAERSRLDRAITGLGDLLSRTEALVASRRKH